MANLDSEMSSVLRFSLVTLMSSLIAKTVADVPVKLFDIEMDVLNRAACIPVSSLPDASVQSGFGQERPIIKINIHFIGTGDLDFTTCLVKSYTDGNSSRPVTGDCTLFKGHINDNLVEFNYFSDDTNDLKTSDRNLASGVSATFHTLENSGISICKIDIHTKSEGKREAETIQTVIYITLIVCAALVFIAVFELFYFCCYKKRLSSRGEAYEMTYSAREHKRLHRLSGSVGP